MTDTTDTTETLLSENHVVIPIPGKNIILETGKVARQASGSIILKCQDTMILSTACASNSPLEDVDFLPFRVDYQEKFSSAGKTLGGFIKREGKPSEKEILTSRLIDRPLRPLFPRGFFHDIQLLTYVLSYDPDIALEPLAICAASAALMISSIPFTKAVGAVRVGMIDGNFIINPTPLEMEISKLDLILAGTKDAILMIEGYCDFLTEDEVLQAIDEGHAAIKIICKHMEDWSKIVGKEKFTTTYVIPSNELLEEMKKVVGDKIVEAFAIADKKKREACIQQIDQEVTSHFLSQNEPMYSVREVKMAQKQISSETLRAKILRDKIRTDGRGLSDIRPITIEPGFLPRAHGSSLFTRGETQTIAVCTLGNASMGQRYETLAGESIRRFYLQYFFPPFSVGEVGRFGPPGRREIGHGKLAERALQATIPSEADFPYTIRLESNITESNGSSSMASVCGGCLSMMDAGVPIQRPVSGIAMGLILEGEQFAILSDILGLEDALGDMDFKITGDSQGITAFQMDIKVEGINLEIMRSALLQAKEGRIHILKKMLEVLPASKQGLSKYAPRLESIAVKPSKIAVVIGGGGKTIRSIIETSGANVEINDDGIVQISSTSQESLEKAKQMILDLVTEVERGKTYTGTISSIQPFGVFVKLPGGKDGLCHISKLAKERVSSIEELGFKLGQEMHVKVLDINDQGKISLSRIL